MITSSSEGCWDGALGGVGAIDGDGEGGSITLDGSDDGLPVSNTTLSTVGDCDGTLVGSICDGNELGVLTGDSVVTTGCAVGVKMGDIVGATVGVTVGLTTGAVVG